MLKPSEAASLMDCTVRAIRKRITLGKLDAVNCNFTEELQDWVQQQNRKGVPLSGDGLSFVSISASNGAFTDWDENFQYGVYKIQGTLIYEKE